MSRTTINFLLDSTLLAAFSVLAFSAVIVRFIFPPGPDAKGWYLWRMSYDQWATTVEGTFRDVNYLATGLATERVPEDDIVVVTVHFTKDNGELSSVSLDERTRVEAI